MSKDHVAGLAIQIPEEMLRQVIVAEVAKALPGPDIVQSVVRAALAAKQNSYDKKTIFENEIETRIRAVCTEVFKAWLAENTDGIRDALMSELNRGKQRKLKEMVEHLAKGFGSLYIRGVTLSLPGDE